MEARYAIRKRPLLDAWQVSPAIFAQVIPRLYSFLKPFVTSFQGQGGAQHATTSVCGLVSNLARTNVASIASRFDHSRLPLHAFIGWEAWADEPLRRTWRHQVKTQVGQGDGGLGFDPAGLPQSRRQSVGVARQWCGRLGQVDHCPGAMSVGYVSSKGHTLVDQRLLLPKDWTKDNARLAQAGVPNAARASRTRHQLAWEMWANKGAGLPHGWMSGDDAMGRPSWCRRRLATWGERYGLAVPSHTARRDLATEPPAYRGQGRRPRPPWQSVAAWS
jgi:SRSO17 transposase